MYKIKEFPEDFVVEELINIKTSKNGRYSYFLLKKKNYNTEDALRTVAERLHIDRRKINCCGNKDKVAITTQHISIENLDDAKKKDYDFNEISLKYLGQGDLRFNLGSHNGNKFTIIVKDANEPKEGKQILNLFGPQRFSKSNHLVGKEIIKGNFDKAVELILQGSGRHEDEMRMFMQEQKNNYIGALRLIPKKTMSLFIHAYQSYLFNEMAKTSSEEKLPLIGFGTDENLVKDILEKEGITTRDFIIRKFPEISSEGDMRERIMKIDDLGIEKIKEKEYKIKFSLPKGSYATVVVDSLFSDTI